MNIFLIGYRCTGKTSVGKSLAEKLGWSFLDADVRLVETYGSSISKIVADEGWDGFRSKEKTITEVLCKLDTHVLAMGGGVILKKENVENMKKSGIVIWLAATPETIKNRIVKDQNTDEYRPALTEKGLVEEIEGVMEERTPLYENAMDFSIATDADGIKTLCSQIEKKLAEKGCLE